MIFIDTQLSRRLEEFRDNKVFCIIGVDDNEGYTGLVSDVDIVTGMVTMYLDGNPNKVKEINSLYIICAEPISGKMKTTTEQNGWDRNFDYWKRTDASLLICYKSGFVKHFHLRYVDNNCLEGICISDSGSSSQRITIFMEKILYIKEE